MNATPAAVRFTYEDYLLFPEDGRRHELIDGERTVAPSAMERHQRLFTRPILLLAGIAEREKLGWVYTAPFDVILSPEDVVQPDVLFVSSEHEERITERGVQGAPDLVVEVTSEGSRRLDEVVKRKLYERFGVAEPENSSWILLRGRISPRWRALRGHRSAASRRAAHPRPCHPHRGRWHQRPPLAPHPFPCEVSGTRALRRTLAEYGSRPRPQASRSSPPASGGGLGGARAALAARAPQGRKPARHHRRLEPSRDEPN